jgi:hypothetical protein
MGTESRMEAIGRAPGSYTVHRLLYSKHRRIGQGKKAGLRSSGSELQKQNGSIYFRKELF